MVDDDDDDEAAAAATQERLLLLLSLYTTHTDSPPLYYTLAAVCVYDKLRPLGRKTTQKSQGKGRRGTEKDPETVGNTTVNVRSERDRPGSQGKGDQGGFFVWSLAEAASAQFSLQRTRILEDLPRLDHGV